VKRPAASVQLARQTDLLPTLQVLRAAGAPIEKLVSESELPESLQDGDDGFLPFRSILRFLGHSARSQGIPTLGWLGDEEGQQFTLGAMVRIVRAAAGPDWVPSRIMLKSSDASEPRKLLAAEESLAGSLRQAVSSLLPALHPSLEVAAEIAEISPRLLRRRLAEEVTSWRKVLDEARLEACQWMLRDPERPLVEIALDLGYSDQAHLTRAFRRWTSEAPSTYSRRRCC